MRWTLGILLSAMVFYGCKEDKNEEPVQIVLLEAPTRLSYVESRYDPQPYETTGVDFSVKLVPAVSSIDTIVCVVRDDLGSKIDSFLLLDDGSLLEHWDHSSCELPVTGDSVADDGIYSRSIRASEFTPNYSGAEISFGFYANSGEVEINELFHTAITWQPWFELECIHFSQELLPPCENLTVIQVELARDSFDFIRSVYLGYWGPVGNVYGSMGHFQPISGDTIWHIVVSPDTLPWENLAESSLAIGVTGEIGRNFRFNLHSFYDFPLVDMNADSIVDTLQIRQFSVPETLWVHAHAELCWHRVPDRVSMSYYGIAIGDHWHVENGNSPPMNDCGIGADAVANDHVFTTFTLISADSLAQEHNIIVQMYGGVCAHPEPCVDSDMATARQLHKIVRLLPPQ